MKVIKIVAYLDLLLCVPLLVTAQVLIFFWPLGVVIAAGLALTAVGAFKAKQGNPLWLLPAIGTITIALASFLAPPTQGHLLFLITGAAALYQIPYALLSESLGQTYSFYLTAGTLGVLLLVNCGCFLLGLGKK